MSVRTCTPVILLELCHNFWGLPTNERNLTAQYPTVHVLMWCPACPGRKATQRLNREAVSSALALPVLNDPKWILNNAQVWAPHLQTLHYKPVFFQQNMITGSRGRTSFGSHRQSSTNAPSNCNPRGKAPSQPVPLQSSSSQQVRTKSLRTDTDVGRWSQHGLGMLRILKSWLNIIALWWFVLYQSCSN